MDDELYFIFDMDTLYTMKKSEVGKALAKKAMFPEFKMWTTYG